jgi:glycosyltransferase involved in cell wall biosynthesis
MEMSRMKVTVFVEYFPPKLGSDRRIFEIMKRLSKKHEIHFVVFPPFRTLTENSNQSRNTFDNSNSSLKENAVYEGINGHFVSIPSKVTLMWQRSLILAYCMTSVIVFLKTVRIMRKINSDIVVLNYPSPYTGLLGFFEAKLWRKPVVLDFNDLIAQYLINLLKLRKDSLKARILILVQHLLAKASSEVVAPTEFIRRYATSLKVQENKTSVIPNGVDTRIFHPNVPRSNRKNVRRYDDERLCIYCGRLDGWAGMNIVFKLADVARSEKMNVKFVLAGSGAERIVSGENVALLGEVSYEEIPSILKSADVILIPFPNNEVSHAASPLKLFEGMSMQKPVIASRVSGIEDIVTDGENGFLADPDNIEEWATKLETATRSEALSAEMGLKARRTVEERFDWTLLASRFEEVLRSATSKHKQL